MAQAVLVDAPKADRLPATPPHAAPARVTAPLRRVVALVCVAMVGVQLVGLILWSAKIASQASLTWDFATYYQAWYQIAHGHLLARDTLHGGLYFFQNDGELIVYVLAPLYWLFPNHVVGYLWLQDLAIAGSSGVCLHWVTKLVPWRATDPRGRRVAAAICWPIAAAFLVFNPWVYWVASFDIHMEPFAVFFVLLGLRALIARRRSAYLWLALTLACGAAATLYVIGAGLTALVVLWWNGRRGSDGPLGSLLAAAGQPSSDGASRRRLAVPGAIALLGVLWLMFLDAIKATNGSASQGYAYLVNGFPPSGHPTTARVALGVLQHPVEVAHVFATHGWNLWANLSPDGLLGLLTVPGFLLSAPTLISENLFKFQSFSYPSFQSFVVYCFVAIGSVGVVAFLLRHRRLWPLGAVLVVAMMVNLGGWFLSWFSTTESQFVLITTQGAALVRKIAGEAGPSAEAVVSQGVVGVFAGRSQIYSFNGPMVVPLRSKTLWFVFAPGQGAESASPDQTMEAITAIQQLAGVRQIDDGTYGIYIYRWHPPRGQEALSLAEPGAHLPAWNALGTAGAPVTNGPSATWHAAATGATGDVVANDYFPEVPGRYDARLSLRSNVPVTAEVWDVYDHAMLAGKVVAPSRGTVTVTVPFAVHALGAAASPPPPPSSVGSGPFRYSTSSPGSSPVPTISIVLWTPAGGHESVYWFSIAPS